MRVDAHAQLLRILTLVHRRNPEGLCDFLRLLNGVIDPALPPTILVHEDELGIVQAYPDHNPLGGGAAPRDELIGAVEGLDGLDVFKRPCSWLCVHA
jgi:hypothetical protein